MGVCAALTKHEIDTREKRVLIKGSWLAVVTISSFFVVEL
jgi:hypothetical protein